MTKTFAFMHRTQPHERLICFTLPQPLPSREGEFVFSLLSTERSSKISPFGRNDRNDRSHAY